MDRSLFITPSFVYNSFPKANPDDSNDVQHIVVRLLLFADDCEVMVQWPGQYRSDFGSFQGRRLSPSSYSLTMVMISSEIVGIVVISP